MTATLAATAAPVTTRRPRVLGRASRVHVPFRLHTAPAMLAALCFASGILLAHFLQFMPGLLFIALLCCFVVAGAACWWASRLAWLSTSLLYIILGVFCLSAAPGVDQERQLALMADGTQRLVDGEIVRVGPVRTLSSSTPFSNKIREELSQQIDLRLRSISGMVLSNALVQTLRITVYAPVDAAFPALACGAKVRGVFAMHTEEQFLDPGVWDAGAYLNSQGIGALASVQVGQISIASIAGTGTLGCRLHSLEEGSSAKILGFADDARNRRLPDFLRLDNADAAMLAAMLTGDRSYLRHRLRQGFERTGSFHLLVVSGLHLGIFSTVIFASARRLRLSHGWASLITIVCSLGYAAFAGFGHPVQRALGMVTLYLIGRLLWRDRSAFNAIGLVALFLLVADPGSLFDSGLQMTLLSVIAIAGLAAPISERTFGPYLRAMRNLKEIRIDPALQPRVAQFRVSLRMLAQYLRPLTGRLFAWTALPFGVRLALRIAELLVVSMSIEVLMMMPMMVYFHRVTLLALPVNLLIVPFLGLLLPCALVAFAAIALAPSLAFVPAAATAALLHCVTFVVSSFAAMRAADWRAPMPAPLSIALWIGLCVVAICLVRLRRFGLISGIGVLVAATAVIVLPRPVQYRPHELEITAIDVGQGDSLLVVTPEGKTLLIDAGGLIGAAPDSNFDVGEDVVSPMLWSRGIRRLDAMAITHAHADHLGGMPAVLENFRPRELWVGKNPDVPSYDHVLDIAKQVGARVEPHVAGDSFYFGGTSIRVLAPTHDYQPGNTPTNNDSLVLRMSYGKTSALLEGDAEAPSEAEMVAAGGLRSDLLKVGHHGSRTSTTPAFLAAVSPAYSVISVGRRNFYGHPRREVLEELQSAHVRTFLTDMSGLTSFYLDGMGVSAEPWAAERH